MGITEVHQESGEIWVYIPEKAQRITLRHPKFGIIRDYCFPVPIESATVYEMVLATPQRNNGEIPETIVIEHKFAPSGKEQNKNHNIAESIGRSARGEKGNKAVGNKKIEYTGFLILADLGANRTPSYGIRAAFYKRIGGYINFRSNFKRGTSDYGCLSDGSIGNSGSIWTTGREKMSRYNISAGLISRITNWLSLYAGAGYGTRTLLWEDIGGNWAKVEDFSYTGAAIDAGAVFTINDFAVSAGISSVAFDWCELSLGFGVRF